MKGKQGSLFHLFVIVISLGLCVQSARTIAGLWQRRDVMRVRKLELEHKAKQNAELQAQLKEMQGDDYVEKVARDTLGLVKDGEAIVILPKQVSDDQHQGGDRTISNWQKWWGLFF